MDVFIKEELDASLIDDYLLSEDIWKQYQIEEMQLHSLPTTFDPMTCSLLCETNCQVKHDCMWNGHCKGNRTCTTNNKPALLHPPAPGQLDIKQTPVAQVSTTQQSLLKPDLRLSVDPSTIVPMMPALHYSIQTPPISDDEDAHHQPTQILQSLQSAISENELDDADLSDYFKGDGKDWVFFDDDLDDDEEEEEEEEEDDKKPNIEDIEKHETEMRAYYAASDHSYHKGTHADMRFGNLGIDTPSDSEEEIDVVSLGGDKFNGVGSTNSGSTISSKATSLPTNPSIRDRRQIQMTMQSRFPPLREGLKTLLPVKRAVVPKKAQESRGRGRQYKRTKQNQRQYKRKYGCGHSSDSEPEPSEKRHLHNNMERQRRIDLRNLFNDLKKLLPDVNKKPRVAKVAILRGAAQYCTELQRTEEGMKRKVETMKQKQAYLRAQLSRLRRDVAAKR